MRKVEGISKHIVTLKKKTFRRVQKNIFSLIGTVIVKEIVERKKSFQLIPQRATSAGSTQNRKVLMLPSPWRI